MSNAISEMRLYVPCNCCTSSAKQESTEKPKAPGTQAPQRDEYRPGPRPESGIGAGYGSYGKNVSYTERSFTSSYSYTSISSSGTESFSAQISIQSKEVTVQVSDSTVEWMKHKMLDMKLGRDAAPELPFMGYSVTAEGRSYMVSFEASRSFMAEITEWIESCKSLIGGDLSRAFGEQGAKWAARMFDDSPDALRAWLGRKISQNREAEEGMKMLRPDRHHRPEHGRRPEHGHRPDRPSHGRTEEACCPIWGPAKYKKPENLPANQLAQRQEELLKQAVELLNRGLCRCNTGKNEGGCNAQQAGYTKRFSGIAVNLSGEMGEDDIIQKSNEVHASRREVYNEWYNSTEDHDSAEALSRLDEAHIDWVTNLRDTDPTGFRVWLEMNVKPHVWGYDMENLIVPEDFTLEDYNTWMTQSVRDYMNAAESASSAS